MGRRIASESKQTVRGGPKPAKVGLHRRLALQARKRFVLVLLRAFILVPRASRPHASSLGPGTHRTGTARKLALISNAHGN